MIGQITALDDEARHLMGQLGFVSVLLLPIGEPVNWVRVIGFGEINLPREWEEHDIQLLYTVGQMICAYLERLRNARVVAQARDEG